ncbi:hypothetical protein GGC03_08035 [Vibrio sp. THAF191c]|nr:hypothetical protein FIU99_08015 [Vibrio sp. THAF64]QGM34276.1 hypothetical protein GGC04_08030 [Vibrio sp. THAF191d]QGN69778.1 hypothetical protein GGC03_08035 [Vibrio sp. THAF191c]
MGLLDAMLISLITGVVSSAGTIAALKTDINWIKTGAAGPRTMCSIGFRFLSYPF